MLETDDAQLLLSMLKQRLPLMSLQITEQQQQQLVHHAVLMLSWNRRLNLTAITAPEQVLSRHLLDSLSILPLIKGSHLLDVGSGGGFPGIPLAICYPHLKVTLLDSSKKKCGFMRHVVQQLQLKHVRVQQCRLNDFKSEACFATIVARAWSSLTDFVLQAERLLCIDGQLIAMKGIYPQHELDELTRPYTTVQLDVPGLDQQRHAVIMTRQL